MDFQRTALYNWGGVALANLYPGFDSVSREATTSFVGPWSIWQVKYSFLLSILLFCFATLINAFSIFYRVGLLPILVLLFLVDPRLK